MQNNFNLNLMGFALLKEKKYKRCSGLEGWKPPQHRQKGVTVGYSQLGFLCGFWSHLILKLGFFRPLK